MSVGGTRDTPAAAEAKQGGQASGMSREQVSIRFPPKWRSNASMLCLGFRGQNWEILGLNQDCGTAKPAPNQRWKAAESRCVAACMAFDGSDAKGGRPQGARKGWYFSQVVNKGAWVVDVQSGSTDMTDLIG